jgi:hypothetical protein
MLVKRRTTHAVCPRCGFTVEVRHHTLKHCEMKVRVATLRSLVMNGAQIAKQIGVSRERIRQVLSKLGKEKAIETIGSIVVTRARKLGKDIALSDVIKILRQS